jgi:Inovirus Coat protein B
MTYDVTAVLAEFTAANAPIAAIGAAALILTVVISVWKRLRGVSK